MVGERTAVDVLLEVEQKQAQILHKQSSLDLLNKINSNKLNEIESKLDQIIELINQMPDEPNQGYTMVEGTTNSHAIATASPTREAMKARIQEEEWKPPIPLTNETKPVGERRTARGEPFATPAQMKKNTPTPSLPTPQMKPSLPQKPVEQAMQREQPTGKHAVEQRIVDRNSKAIFKADVEIIDGAGITVAKTQTGVMGKWNATLAPGKYRVHISKMDAATKNRIQVAQDLSIDARTPKDLPMMVIK